MSEIVLMSPDEQIMLSFAVTINEEGNGVPVYNVQYKGKPMILESRLAFAAFRLKDDRAVDRQAYGGMDARLRRKEPDTGPL
jgi:hypothetical protein